jgi:cell pole-organizing protein PopZ
MPPNIAAQALAKMKINATPADFAQHDKNTLDMAVQKKAIPAALAAHDKAPQAPPPQGGGGGEPRQLRR